MKLMYIVNEINGTTGQQRIVAHKANYFIRNYHYEIVIVVLKEDYSNPFFDLNKKIKVHYLGKSANRFSNSIGKISKINKVVKEESPSIVIVCIDDIYGLYLPLFLNKRLPLIYERHNSKRVNFAVKKKTVSGKILNFIKKTSMNIGALLFDKVVVLSNDHRQEWKQLKNLEVINNPLIFYPEQKASLNNKIVLAVGRHSHQKGYDYLLKSWSKVAKVYEDWELRIYGKKDEDFSLRKLAKEYGISESVTFYNPVSNIHDVYAASSILTLSSRFEGFPLVLIEAMASGVPAVAFNCPYGVKELVTDGEDGILVSPGNVSSFAESITELIENPRLRTDMGNAARRNILRLSPENIFPKWNQMFESLLRN